MVYFGWPTAHEEDAQRAVRAGLDIVEAIGDLESVAELGVRIGIATGLVVVGESDEDAAADAKLAVGETPNIAARLQALAEPNSVAIAESTRRLLGGAFDLADLGGHELKGVSERVQVHQVRGETQAHSRFEATHGLGLTPLVGREAEIAMVMARWDQAKAGDGQVIVLSGEPGIGKSRITQTLRERVANEPHIRLRYQCSPYHTNSALHPVIEQLERAAGFARDDAPEERLDKFEALISTPTSVADHALIASLLSLPTKRYPTLAMSPQKQKEETFKVLADQVAVLSAEQPVLLIFEDAHWIDPTSQELLDLVVPAVAEHRVLAVITHRPEYTPPWLGQGHVTPLSLTRLGRAAAAAMVARVSETPLPEEVLNQIVAKTDGVPLFIEELTKTVIESGAETAHAIPETLQDSLMARLDHLAPVKEVAQLGAAIGREFSHRVLAAVSPLSDNELRSALGQLVESELVFRRGTGMGAQYVFKHALVQDAAHQSVLKSKRKQLHASIADVLERQFGTVSETKPELLAYHYSEAGIYEKAVHYWQIAGDLAAKSTAYAEAIGHCSKGLEILSTLPDSSESARQELTLQMTLGPALMNVKGQGTPEVEQAYARARDLCRSIDDAPTVFPVLFGLWYSHVIRAEHQVALQLAEELLTIADQSGDRALVLAAHRALGQNLCFMGELEQAHSHLQQALLLYDENQHSALSIHYGQDLAVICCAWEGLALWLLGYPNQALRMSRDAIERAQKLADPYSEAYALNWAIMLHLFRGDL